MLRARQQVLGPRQRLSIGPLHLSDTVFHSRCVFRHSVRHTHLAGSHPGRRMAARAGQMRDTGVSEWEKVHAERVPRWTGHPPTYGAQCAPTQVKQVWQPMRSRRQRCRALYVPQAARSCPSASRHDGDDHGRDGRQQPCHSEGAIELLFGRREHGATRVTDLATQDDHFHLLPPVLTF